MMTTIQELAIKDAVRTQKAKYCRHLDTKQFDEWEALFKPNASIIFYNPDQTILGKFDSIAELSPLARKVFGARVTAHQIHNSEIEVNSDRVVTAIWSMSDCQIHPAAEGEPVKAEHGYGFFHETWERVGEAWLIASLELRRTIEWPS